MCQYPPNHCCPADYFLFEYVANHSPSLCSNPSARLYSASSKSFTRFSSCAIVRVVSSWRCANSRIAPHSARMPKLILAAMSCKFIYPNLSLIIPRARATKYAPTSPAARNTVNAMKNNCAGFISFLSLACIRADNPCARLRLQLGVYLNKRIPLELSIVRVPISRRVQ